MYIVFINVQAKINELQEEEEKLRKIINIVRPITLPELTKPIVEENTSKIEQKKNPINDCSQSSVKSTTCIKVNKVDKKIIFDIKEKSEVAVNKEKNDLQEAEGIIIYLNIFFYVYRS